MSSNKALIGPRSRSWCGLGMRLGPVGCAHSQMEALRRRVSTLDPESSPKQSCRESAANFSSPPHPVYNTERVQDSP